MGVRVKRKSGGFAAFRVRTSQAFPANLEFALHYQNSFWIVAGFGAEVFGFVFVRISQVIKAQAILLFIDDGKQFALQHPALGRGKQTLEDAVLHALSVVDALFGNQPKPPFSGAVPGINIVCDHHKQDGTYFHRNGG